jgi:hypothetical protein
MGGENSTTTTGDYWKTTDTRGWLRMKSATIGATYLRPNPAGAVSRRWPVADVRIQAKGTATFSSRDQKTAGHRRLRDIADCGTSPTSLGRKKHRHVPGIPAFRQTFMHLSDSLVRLLVQEDTKEVAESGVV